MLHQSASQLRPSAPQQPLRDYEERLQERRALDAAPITAEVMATAIDLQHEFARRRQHRLLIISAAELASGLTVLHYEADFECIAAVGGAPNEWVVPQASV